MNSKIYFGRVSHRRFTPRQHAFSYRLFMLFVDLNELDRLFDRHWLWSARHFNLAWFRRSDHLGKPEQPLGEAVLDVVEDQLGRRPSGRIMLLTHLRYFGYLMNPVCFYFCYGENPETPDVIVAEVNNTPWGEQHCYVLDESDAGLHPSEKLVDKEFHDADQFFLHMERLHDGIAQRIHPATCLA